MGEVIISASGTQFGLIVNSEGKALVEASVSAGSEVYIKAGSVEVFQLDPSKLTFGLSGNIIIGSVSAHVDSIYIQSGANMLGSVGITNIDNPQTIGSHAGIIPISGVISNFNELGSSRIITNFGDLGSQRTISAGSIYLISTPGSVQVYQTDNANMQVQATQETSPWITSGTSTVAGSVYSTGSINIATNLSSIGSYFIQNISGTITIDNRVAGSIVNLPIGSNFILSSPGSIVVNGSIYSTGSINVVGWPGSLAISNFASLGSSRIITGGSLLVMGQSGGTSYPLLTKTDGTLVVESSVSVETGSNVWVKGGSIINYGVGSVLMLGYDSSATLDSPLIANGSYLMVAGSISSMPPVTASSSSDYKISGTHTGIGSVSLVGGDYGGSAWPIRIFGGSYVMIAGSISSMPSISVSEGAAYLPSGLITDNGSVYLVGGVRAGSIWPLQVVGGSHLLVAGSISSLPAVTQGTSPWVISGTANISGVFIGISGIVNQGTSPWTISGIVNLGSNWGGTGSVFISQNQLASIGSHGGIVSVSGNALGVSGTAFQQVWIGVGSVLAQVVSSAGSIGVYDADNGGISIEPVRGVFIVSGTTLIASGTMSNFITPGTGSRVMLKGFTASAETASHFRLLFSGTTITPIGIWTLPSSGTVAMNFLGMEPSGAVNQPISAGMYNNGSLALTVFIKNTL